MFSENHRKMCDSFDSHVKNRAQIDTLIADAWQNIATLTGIASTISGADADGLADADVIHDCRMREEVALLRVQIAKLEEIGTAKDKRLADIMRELATYGEFVDGSAGSVDQGQLAKLPSSAAVVASKTNPKRLQSALDDALTKERQIRVLEQQVLDSSGRLAQLADELRRESDAADSLQRKATILDAKVEVLQQEIANTRSAIGRAEQGIRDASSRARVTFAADVTAAAASEAGTTGAASEGETEQAQRAILAEIERVEREIEELKREANGDGSADRSGGASGSPFLRSNSNSSPSPPRAASGANDMALRRASSLSGAQLQHHSQLRTYQLITETLALMKAFLFNLNDDLPQITAIIENVTQDPHHDSPEWRRNKLSACFLEVVSMMEERPYGEDANAAQELLNAMKELVVVWDLFEASLEEDIELTLERATIRNEAGHMFTASQVCLDVIAAAAKQRSFGRRKSSVKSGKR